MTLDFPTTIVHEGRTRLIVPADHLCHGPASRRMPVFYNPQMEFSRDISVAVTSGILSDGDSFLDGLAATGARGIRVANESGIEVQLHLNDSNDRALEVMRRNVEINGLQGTCITGKDIRALLSEGSFRCVDIDPFGTPVPFFPMAVGAVRDNGVICVSATDTGTISGVFPAACLRRYGVHARRTPFHQEVGIRTLLGFVAREAAKLEVGISPLISYCADHSVRAFIRVRRGARRADESLSNLGFCEFDPLSLDRRFTEERRSGSLGPLWVSSTCDPGALDQVRVPPDLNTLHRVSRLLSLLKGECRLNRPFFSVDELSSRLRVDPPRLDLLLAELNATGLAARTHHGPKSFVTDVEIGQIMQLFTECRRKPLPNC